MVNAMLGIRLEQELEAQLQALAKKSGKPKSHHAREAIRQYLASDDSEAKRQSRLVSQNDADDFEADTRGWTK